MLTAHLSSHSPHCKDPIATCDQQLPYGTVQGERVLSGTGPTPPHLPRCSSSTRSCTWLCPKWFYWDGLLLFPGVHSTPVPYFVPPPLLAIQLSLPSFLSAWLLSHRPQTVVPHQLGNSLPAAACPRCPPKRRPPRLGTSTTAPGTSGARAWTAPAPISSPPTGRKGRLRRTPALQREWTTSPSSM